jgi:hypothetical protein
VAVADTIGIAAVDGAGFLILSFQLVSMHNLLVFNADAATVDIVNIAAVAGTECLFVFSCR